MFRRSAEVPVRPTAIIGWGLVGAVAFAMAEYSAVAIGCGSFEITASFEPPPPAETRLTYVLTQSKLVPLYLANPPTELDPGFVAIVEPGQSPVRIRVPFSSRSTWLLGREYGYVQPDELILVRFEPKDGKPYFSAATLPYRDESRRVVVRVPQPGTNHLPEEFRP
jgi:hypothetical protein